MLKYAEIFMGLKCIKISTLTIELRYRVDKNKQQIGTRTEIIK